MKTGKMVLLAVVLGLIFSLGQTAVAKYASELVAHSTPHPEQDPQDVLGSWDENICQFDGNPGDPGWVILGFGGYFYDMPGDDIVVHVTDWPPIGLLEIFSVEISEDGENFFFVAEFDPSDYNAPEYGPFSLSMDISSSGLQAARYVKIINGQDNAPTPNEGPEIDAVEVKNFYVPLPYEDGFENISVGDYPNENGWQNLTSGSMASVMVSPDDVGKIVFHSNEEGYNEIYVMDPNGGQIERLTFTHDLIENQTRWSPDGSKIVFVAAAPVEKNQIYIMNADGTGRRKVTNSNDYNEEFPDWSADGTKLCYSRSHNIQGKNRGKICIIDIDGSGEIELSSGLLDLYPSWSQDGQEIAFSRVMNPDAAGWDFRIFKLRIADPNTEVQLTNTGDTDSRPSWSPDGEKIVFLRNELAQPWHDQIMKMNSDGSNQVNITNDYSSRYYEPSWSPDGSHIIYHKAPGTSSVCDIWIMEADGSNPEQITNTSGITELGTDWDAGQSFGLVSWPSWSRCDYLALPELPDRLTYEVSVYCDPTPGRMVWIGFPKLSGGQLALYNRFQIKSNDGVNGMVDFEDGIGGSPSASVGTFLVGEWVTVQADLDFMNNVANLWLDGELKVSRFPIVSKEFDDPNPTFGHVVLAKWGASEYGWGGGGTGTFYLDDVSLTANLFNYTFYVNGECGNDSWLGLEPDCSTSHGPKKTIQAAIDAAWHGDTVLVWPGVYVEDISFLQKAITVKSAADAAVLESESNYAVSFYSGEGPGSVLENFVIRNSYAGIQAVGSSPTIRFVTVVNNDHGIIADITANPNISNSILWNNTYGDLIDCEATYSCIQDGNPGVGNISVDPNFADRANGDFHLLSERGRYMPVDPNAFGGKEGFWVLDEATSPCIDAGDPGLDERGERMPNGARVNMGAYGGTAYASRSEWPLEADLNFDGIVNLADFVILAGKWLVQIDDEL